MRGRLRDPYIKLGTERVKLCSSDGPEFTRERIRVFSCYATVPINTFRFSKQWRRVFSPFRGDRDQLSVPKGMYLIFRETFIKETAKVSSRMKLSIISQCYWNFHCDSWEENVIIAKWFLSTLKKSILEIMNRETKRRKKEELSREARRTLGTDGGRARESARVRIIFHLLERAFVALSGGARNMKKKKRTSGVIIFAIII